MKPAAILQMAYVMTMTHSFVNCPETLINEKERFQMISIELRKQVRFWKGYQFLRGIWSTWVLGKNYQNLLLIHSQNEVFLLIICSRGWYGIIRNEWIIPNGSKAYFNQFYFKYKSGSGIISRGKTVHSMNGLVLNASEDTDTQIGNRWHKNVMCEILSAFSSY